MINEISLIRFLENNCDCKGCMYNCDGQCMCEDYDFVVSRLEDIKTAMHRGIVTDMFFTCDEAVPDENICLECGSALVENRELAPYGDSYAVENILECPRGC